MSSDNFLLIRRYNGLYVVTDESASADEPSLLVQAPDGSFVGKRAVAFDCWGDAMIYAQTQYSEYGITDASGHDPIAELNLENARLRKELQVARDQIQTMHDNGLGPSDWGPEDVARLRKIAMDEADAIRKGRDQDPDAIKKHVQQQALDAWG